MDIFGVLSFVGGLAMFLYGMSAMGDGLTKLSGGKLEYLLEKLTSKRIMAVLLGAGVTAVIQSSSATTVMVVGFVNSGIMKLNQAVGIIMGANIGTTITSWILSLTGIQGDNVFIKMLNPSSFSPILAIIGVFMLMLAKSDKKKNVGTLLTGFSILMFGMHTMSSAVSPLADVPEFTGLLVKFSIPVLGVLAGTILTAVIQSSSASVGILQALCATGSVSYAVALPIIMGQNIGTCITALLSSIGTSRNARRTAMVHLYFNIIGTVLFLVLFYGINAFVHFPFLETSANAAGIAIVHSGFNIFATLILFPFADGLVKLAKLTIPDGPEEKADEAVQMLDTRFLDSPAFALQQCKVAAAKMAELTAREIYNIRDSKNTILRGQAETMPKDGASLQLVIDQLNKQEKALMQAFTGTTDRTDKVFTILVEPNNDAQEQVAARFSTQLGVLPTDNLAGDPIYVSIRNTSTLPMPEEDKKKKKADGAIYNVPGKGNVTVTYQGKKLFNDEMSFTQFGYTEVLVDGLFVFVNL